MKRKVLATVVTASMIASMAVCPAAAEEVSAANTALINCKDVTPDDSRPNTSNSEGKYDSVTIVGSMEISELQPYNVDDAAKGQALREIFEPLYDMYGLDDYRGRLAVGEPEIVDDTHYRVTIYDYITDSDGNNITAADVAFSYDLARDSGFGNDWKFYESAAAVDDYTVEFTFTEPLDSLTAYYNLFTKVYIVSEKAYTEKNMATAPVGTGPYVVTEFVAGSGVTTKAREDYWQTDELRSEWAAANVENLRWDVVGDDALSLVALQEGKSDYKFMRADWSMFQEGGEYEGVVNLYAHDNTQNHTILPNCSENSPCSDINLRLAIYYAIDSASICQAISADTKFPSAADISYLVSDYQSAWDEAAADNYQGVYDPELAKEYLEKSSYNGETLTILLQSNDEKKLEAQLVQGYLSAIGINAELAVYENSVISGYESDPSYWDILIYSGNGSDYAISKWMIEYGAANNDGLTKNFIDDEEFQNMLTTCASASGYSGELTQQIGEYIIDHAYAYGTYYSMEIYAFSPKLATICMDFWGQPIFGACEYYLD